MGQDSAVVGFGEAFELIGKEILPTAYFGVLIVRFVVPIFYIGKACLYQFVVRDNFSSSFACLVGFALSKGACNPTLCVFFFIVTHLAKHTFYVLTAGVVCLYTHLLEHIALAQESV